MNNFGNINIVMCDGVSHRFFIHSDKINNDSNYGLREWINLVSFILRSLEMVRYHVYLSHAYAEHNEHFHDGHPGLRAGRTHRQLEMLLLNIFLLLNVSRDRFQLILKQFQVLAKAVQRLNVCRVLTVRDGTLHVEVKFLALAISLFPAQVNLFEAR